MYLHPTRSLILVALGHLSIELSSNFLPVVYPILIGTLGLTFAQIGAIAFVAGLGTSLMQPLFGLLSDRWYPQLITTLSITWCGVAMALVGYTWDYVSLVLIVGLGALGSAAFHPSGATVASASRSERRGAAVSVFSVGGNIGSALSPVLVTAGIAWLGMRGTSLLIPIALAVSLLLYRQLGRAGRAEGRRISATHSVSRDWSWAWLVLIVVAMMFRAWFQVSFVTYLPTWIQDQGGSLAAGGRQLFVFLASVGVGSLIGGAMSDRIGRWQVLAICLAFLGPVEWLFLNSSNPFQIPLLVVMGALLGATFPVSIVMAQEAWPRGPGVASGLVMGLPWVAGGIGASLTGLVADRFSLTAGLETLVLAAALSAAPVFFYAALRRNQDKAESLQFENLYHGE
jgi:FSR family fosmidomycin resistance protein-like MFS transporter